MRHAANVLGGTVLGAPVPEAARVVCPEVVIDRTTEPTDPEPEYGLVVADGADAATVAAIRERCARAVVDCVPVVVFPDSQLDRQSGK